MKKALIFLLVFLLAFSSVASANFDLTALSDQELLELAHQVVDELSHRHSGGVSPNHSNVSLDYPEFSGETVEMFSSHEDKYLNELGDWSFPFFIRNTTDTDLFIYSLTFLDNGADQGDYRDGQNDPFIFENMMGPEFDTTPLRPGETMRWQDNHPGEFLTSRTYLFVFRGADGKDYTASYSYNLLMQKKASLPTIDEVSDDSKDLITLRHGADYMIEVHNDVFWRPVSSLGESRLTNGEVRALLRESPETLQAEITMLYEALQLYQLIGFCASDDNIRIPENGINWEHHKPGYYAVLTNNGCCASSANWLNYILKDDYDEVGFVATSQRDGGGHIFNYILQDGQYYFIDLTHYRTDWIATAPETAALDDYYSSDFVLGNLHMSPSVESYVNFMQFAFNDPPGLMFMYTAEDCLAIDGVHDGDGIHITYENNPEVEIHVIFDDPGDHLDFVLADPPTIRPDNWK